MVVADADGRVVDGPSLELIGDGGYALGARATQIRERLMAIERATTRDIFEIQLDDRALFLDRWRALLLDELTSEAIAEDSRRGELRGYVEAWDAHARVDAVGYRLVREFRLQLRDEVLGAVAEGCSGRAIRDLSFAGMLRSEGPL